MHHESSAGGVLLFRMHIEPPLAGVHLSASLPNQLPVAIDQLSSFHVVCVYSVGQSRDKIRSTARHLIPADVDVSLRQRSSNEFAAGEYSNLNLPYRFTAYSGESWPVNSVDMSRIQFLNFTCRFTTWRPIPISRRIMMFPQSQLSYS